MRDEILRQAQDDPSAGSGQGATVQEIDGFKIDLNRVTRRQFYEALTAVAAAQRKGDGLAADTNTGQLLERVMVEWPFETAITADNYLDLPMYDAKRVDRALEEAIDTLLKKK